MESEARGSAVKVRLLAGVKIDRLEPAGTDPEKDRGPEPLN